MLNLLLTNLNEFNLIRKKIKVIQRNNYKLKNKYFKTIFTQVVG